MRANALEKCPRDSRLSFRVRDRRGECTIELRILMLKLNLHIPSNVH